ncbi:MAG: vWA domain-containing protein [Planctomycetota bacterium]
MEQVPFRDAALVDNPEPRVPSMLLLDTSGSMTGRPIEELNEGLKVYREQLLCDTLAVRRVEVAIITFGGKVSLVTDFVTADQLQERQLKASGNTLMGGAIHKALDLLDQRKLTYRSHGLAYYRPWAFLITDGAPSDEWQSAAERIHGAEKEKSLAFFTVGVSGADFDVLKQLGPRTPLQLKGLRFQDLFQWLSNSQKSVSRSSPGEEVRLESPTAPDGWAAV